MGKKVLEKAKKGFTLIELSITMAFVAVLLISIAVITSNMLAIFQKGITIKTVNSVGRAMIDELTLAVQASPSVDTYSLCNLLVTEDNRDDCINGNGAGNAFRFVFQEYRSNTGEDQYGGIFCTGRYSYVWNTYYGLDTGHTLSVKYLDQSEDGAQKIVGTDEDPIRLIRFEDSSYRICSASLSSDYSPLLSESYHEIDITETANLGEPYIVKTPETGSLEKSDLDLVFYEFTVFPISQDSVTYRTYMSASFVLATTRGYVEMQPGVQDAGYCSLNGVYSDNASNVLSIGSEFNYCAINKFNFAARTAGT